MPPSALQMAACLPTSGAPLALWRRGILRLIQDTLGVVRGEGARGVANRIPTAGCEIGARTRTCVRITSYMIAAPDKPRLTLFASPNLGAVAEALAAQREADHPASMHLWTANRARSRKPSSSNFPAISSS